MKRPPSSGAPVRDRLAELSSRYGLLEGCAARFEALLSALALEPDPHTTDSAPERAVDAHIADSLTALELPQVVSAGSIVDVGAGAGFPGLALAVALPSATVHLLESRGRKCAVIERLAEASATEVVVVQARAEEFAVADGPRHDLVTARAVARLAVLVEYAAPLLVEGGCLVAWKGARDETEEAGGSAAAHEVGLALRTVQSVKPFAAAHSRHLHVYEKVAATPARFPRRPGVATKRPLGRR